jgi:hypothetical protein
MTIGIIFVILFTFMGYAVSQGESGAALSVLGYLIAFVGISTLIIFGCMAAYAKFIHYLWTL